jgi:hypothetical protein
MKAPDAENERLAGGANGMCTSTLDRRAWSKGSHIDDYVAEDPNHDPCAGCDQASALGRAHLPAAITILDGFPSEPAG